MSTTVAVDKPIKQAASKPRRRGPGGAALGKDQSREAQRVAAAILEVLAGTRTPGQAAEALGVSITRYYQLEGRALRGFVAGCEPMPKGRGRNADKELAVLRRQQERLQRELGRQQTLVRLAQRSIGLPAPAARGESGSAAGAGKGKRRRRPVVRALSAAAQLQRQSQDAAAAATLSPGQEPMA